jgi:cobalamin biosynthesis Mg chelatase CobN
MRPKYLIAILPLLLLFGCKTTRSSKTCKETVTATSRQEQERQSEGTTSTQKEETTNGKTARDYNIVIEFEKTEFAHETDSANRQRAPDRMQPIVISRGKVTITGTDRAETAATALTSSASDTSEKTTATATSEETAQASETEQRQSKTASPAKVLTLLALILAVGAVTYYIRGKT